MATPKPPFTSPSTFSAGMRTLSKVTTHVLLPRMPSFFSGGPGVMPACSSRLAMKAVILVSLPTPVGVLANTV